MKTLLLTITVTYSCLLNAQTLNTNYPLLIDGGILSTLGTSNTWSVSFGTPNQLLGMNNLTGVGAAMEYKSLATSTSGSDFAIDLTTTAGVITFKLPDADGTTGSTKRGVVSTGTQSFAGNKEFKNNLFISTGSVTAPSFAFSAASTTGFSYNTASGYNKALLSFPDFNTSGTSVLRFAFRQNGSFNLTNDASGNYIDGQALDINIFHVTDNVPTPIVNNVQDGGVSVSTYAGIYTHTGTFGGRTAAGNPGDISNNSTKDLCLVAFIGKGYAGTDWEHSNRGAFEVYASDAHTTTYQPAYCVIQTTRKDAILPNDHISFLVDDAGNAGLTYNKLIPIAYANGWSGGSPTTDYDSRFLTIESHTTTTDVGLFMQNSNANKGINIWLDNDQDISYIDNIRNSNSASFKMRFKTAGAPVTGMTMDTRGVAFGGGSTSSGTGLSVGSSNDFAISTSGKLTMYNNVPPSNGQIPIGDGSGAVWSMGTISSTSGIFVTNGAGSISLAPSNDLGAVENITTYGIAARTSLETWTTRTITAGSGVTVTNGDGVSGNPTISAVPGAIIGGTGNQNAPASTTAYCPIIGTSSFSTTEADRQMVMPYAGTIKNLYISTSSAQPASGTLILTIRKNGIGTSLTKTINASDPAGIYTDLTNSFTFNAGDLVSLQAVNNATGNSAKIISWTVQVTQ